MTTRFQITVQPRSKRRGVVPFGEGFKVLSHAPPVDGAANQDVIEVMADALGLPKSAVTIESGHTSKHKTLGIAGLSIEEIHQRLGKLL